MSRIYAILKDTDIALVGMLHDSWKTISATTSGLNYREYFDVNAQILIRAHEMLISAMKEIEVSGKITFKSTPLLALVEKDIEVSDAKVIISMIIETAIISTFEAHGTIGIFTGFDTQSQKYIDDILSKLRIVSSLDEIQINELLNTIAISVPIQSSIETVDMKKMTQLDSALALITNLSSELIKYTSNINSKTQIQASLALVSVSFRKMYELYDLTMDSIYQTNMEDLYMIVKE